MQTKKKNLNAKEECPVHGGHTWGDCRLNPRSENYDPPKPYFRNNQRQNDNFQGQTNQNCNQNFLNRNNNQRQNQGQNSGQQDQRHHYLNQDNNDGGQQDPQNQAGVTWNARNPRESSYANFLPTMPGGQALGGPNTPIIRPAGNGPNIRRN